MVRIRDLAIFGVVVAKNLLEPYLELDDELRKNLYHHLIGNEKGYKKGRRMFSSNVSR